MWQSIGNGYYLEARADSILLYSYTSSFCYKEKNDYLEGLLNSQSQYRLRGDTLVIYLTDYGEKTDQLQSKKDFVHVAQLPDHCISFQAMTELPPKDQFQLYRETMEEHFAFQERRELDWEGLFTEFNDSISTEEALFESMGKIATRTRDQHTKVIDSVGRRRQYSVTPSALIVQQQFEQQSAIKDLNEYFNVFFQTNALHISDSLLMGQGEKIMNDNIEWGILEGNVGYIKISSFAGYLGREFSRKQQIDSLRFHMDRIIDSLQHTKVMIIDIGFNFGGYDATGLTIAGYFTDEPVFAYASEVYYQGEFYNESNIVIQPAQTIRYSQPVYVLMTDISRSAAESFAMMMDAIPSVQLVGTSTLGILSGMLGKSIASFYTTYSNQRLVNASGDYFEGTGVPPDIPLPVFPEGNVMHGHLEAVRNIVAIIEETDNRP